jgi:hypothetical protein
MPSETPPLLRTTSLTAEPFAQKRGSVMDGSKSGQASKTKSPVAAVGLGHDLFEEVNPSHSRGTPMRSGPSPQAPLASAKSLPKDLKIETSTPPAIESEPAVPGSPRAETSPLEGLEGSGPGSVMGDEAAAMQPSVDSKQAIRSIKTTLARIDTKMGWGKDGAMIGLKIGMAMGVGAGLLSALFSMPHLGIAAMVLAPVMGLVYGLYAQSNARKAAAELKDELQANIKDFEATAGEGAQHPKLLEAKTMLAELESGSFAQDIGKLMSRLMGPIGAGFTAKLAELRQARGAAAQPQEEELADEVATEAKAELAERQEAPNLIDI